MLPYLRHQARAAFAHLRPEAREEAVEETLSNVLAAFVRLVGRGKAHPEYARPLVHFAVAQVRQGRRVGARLNSRCLLSPYAQYRRGFRVERLDHFDGVAGEWEEIVVEDRRATPAELAATRLDFAAWLRTLGARPRRIAKALAVGHSTQETARRFSLSPGRISQYRRELERHWERFQRPPATESALSAPARRRALARCPSAAASTTLGPIEAVGADTDSAVVNEERQRARAPRRLAVSAAR